MKPTVAGVIVAAGASTRMGRPKPLIAIAGRPMLQWVVDAAEASVLDRVVVVTGPGDGEIRSSIETGRASFARNPSPGRGTMSSLRVGVAAAGPADAVMKLVADQPGVATADIDALVDAWDPHRHAAGLVEYEDGPGHPLLVAAPLLGEVLHEDGDRLLWDLVLSHPTRLVVRSERHRPIDVNTPDDVARAAVRLG